MARILFIKVAAQVEGAMVPAAPPLGLLSLVAWGRARRPADVHYVHEEAIRPSTDADYARLLREFGPDVVGVSGLSAEWDRMLHVGALVRRTMPHVPVVAGGPHATACTEQVLASGAYTHVFAGEAELTFTRFLDGLDRGDASPSPDIGGLSYLRPDGSLHTMPYNREVPSAEEAPVPAWDLVDFDAYARVPRMTLSAVGRRYAPMMTSRGCPYRCTYCHDVVKKGFRAADVKRAVDDMQRLVEVHGVRDLEIVDDIFNANYDRALAICEEIVRRRLGVCLSFPNGLRGDKLDRTLIDAMAAAGTYYMSFAVETPTPRLQKLIRKHNDPVALEENIGHSVRAGIFTSGFFMLGFPTETRQELWATVLYALRLPLHIAHFFVVVPYGGTALQREYFPVEAPDLAQRQRAALVHGGTAGPLQLMRTALSGAAASTGTGLPAWRLGERSSAADASAEVTPEEVAMIQSAAAAAFYFDPRRMARILRDYPYDRATVLPIAYYKVIKYALLKRPATIVASLVERATAAAS